MKIVIPAIKVPFIRGGAERMTEGLADALRHRGHEVETIHFPFKFSPESALETLMAYCETLDVETFNGKHVDKAIALQFPAYYVNHPDLVLWLMHQHRAAYELYDAATASPELTALRQKIHRMDTLKLGRIAHRYSMCKNVSRRLEVANGISSVPVYHPPAHEDSFFCAPAYNYIFYPSRLEALKRQDLLIRAMAHTKTPVCAIIAGEGGVGTQLNALVHQLKLQDRVRLTGYISEAQKITLYARSLGVFFGPFDEDYGYVTLEAMLASKPVITCTDSGGPLEFVVHNDTGFVSAPEPREIAHHIDWLWTHRHKAAEMGAAGRSHYAAQQITWDKVVDQLL